MQSSFTHRLSRPDALGSALLLLCGAACLLLNSPKWLWPLAAWIGPACFLYYAQFSTIRRKWGWLLLAFVPATALAQLNVMPFPWFVLVVFVLFDGLKTVLLYALHRWLVDNRTGFVYTLIFPALWTVREFLETRGDAGAFASVANTQYAFPWLVQLVSVTGLWGITFLLYWFASVLIWAVRAYLDGRPFGRGAVAYGLVMTAVLAFGAYRYETNALSNAKQVAVGGVTVPNLPILEALYHDQTGQSLRLDSKASPASPALQQANQALAAFIQHPQPARFKRGLTAMHQQQNDLFRLSQQAVGRGAQFVLWSEANALLLKTDEPALIRRGRDFASRNRVYLLMAIGAILPGEITAARLFLENKTVLIDPAGRIVNTFFKNHPVPMAERSRPGDGMIPAIQTPVGTVAPSICYDAEHTNTMRQLGQKRIGLLLLPSGDWHSIAPYHSYMAIFRAVENGCSLARCVSGGLSVFADYRGKLLASRDAYATGDNLTVVRMPIGNVATPYTRFGDWLAFGCMGILIGFAAMIFIRHFRSKQIPKQFVAETAAA